MRGRLRACLALSAAALAAGCGPFGSVDTEGIERDVFQRLLAQQSLSGPTGAPQGGPPPAVSVSCPEEVEAKEGTRFRCEASVTRIGSPGSPAAPGAPGTGAPGVGAPGTSGTNFAQQSFVAEGTVTSDSGDARWSLRPAD